jgi:hypothetical protein
MDQVGDQVMDLVWGFIYGQHDSGWLSFYDFFKSECGLKNKIEVVEGLIEVSKQTGWVLPYKNICFVSERHNTCKLKDGVLHCEDGPAISYPDKFSVWSMNGVPVTKEIVETPADKLDPRLILTEKNAEVRREIVRKIGIERICQKLETKTIDKKGDYELLMLPIPEMKTEAKYLKMKNPSIDAYHMEGVPSDIKTCQEAINWRAFGDVSIQWTPSQLT